MFTHPRILIFIAVLSSTLFAQTTNTDTKPDYSQEAVVVEQSETKLVFENDGTGTREQSTRIRVQSETGVRQSGIVTLSYQSASESVDVDYVRVTKPDGSVVTTPLDNIQDMPSSITQAAPFYSDLREKHIAVKGLSVGDTLEFRVHWHITKPLATGQFWYAYDFNDENIMLDEQLQISVPLKRDVKWKSGELKPAIEEKNGYRTFTWKSSNLTRKSTTKNDAEQEKQVYQAARGQLAPPDVEFSSFQSWEEVGRWYDSLQADRVKPGPEIQAKAAELTKGLSTDDAKILAIYNYVSKQFRYIGVAFGIGRYQPHSATDVLSNQYGDCKDKHTLLASLLQAAGIAAYPALINSSRALEMDVPSPGQFDHVISVIPQDKTFLWLDTTAEIAAPGVLIPGLRDKQALAIPTGKSPLFLRTPAEPPFANSTIFKAEGKLSDAGIFDSQMEQTTRGDGELLFRAVFRQVSEAQWDQLVQNISYRLGFAGTVSDVTATQPDDTGKPFDLKYSYHRADYSDWEHHRITLPFPPLGLPALKANQTELVAPVWLGSIGEVHYTAAITMPKDYTPAVPANVQLKQDFAEYTATYSYKDGILTGDRRLVVKQHEVPITEFKQYKSFLKSIDDDWDNYIVLNAPGAPNFPTNPMAALWQQINTLPASDNADAQAAMKRGMDATSRGDMNGMIAAMKDAVTADPKFTRGWIGLSQLYMATGKKEEGLDAIRKAVESNPELPIARKLLAYALMQNQKDQEAIETWQILQKDTPDDQDVTMNLGMLFSREKRYSDAISLLENAVKEHPDNPGELDLLASSYLKSGDTDKGVATFESLIKLHSDAGTENNVAYELADANTALPKALEYSQKSVQDEEQASQKTQIDKLETEDLFHPGKLSAYWDTLGWIYFRMGDTPKAESYIRAAFGLSGSAVVADHLGQVYEQEHKAESAIKMYRAALLQNSNLAETQNRLDHLTHTHESFQPGANAFQFKPDPHHVRDYLNDLRTVHLPRIVSGDESAEFFVLIAPGGKVKGAHYISGSEKLKSAEKTLIATPFKVPFPTGSNALILRRGILGCYTYTGCSFVMLELNQVNSVN